MLLATLTTTAEEATLDLELAFQGRFFAEEGVDGQSRAAASIALRGEWVKYFGADHRVVVTPFARVDANDPERTHIDLREAFWSQVGSDWELSVGAKQMFWGVTEFHHLVDVINQTDGVENIDDEDRLGQPMVHLSLLRDWGTLDIVALLGFRERTFAGREGRLRLPVKVDSRRSRFASSAEEFRIGGALRWSHHFGGLDIGLYHFSGTGRDPVLQVTHNDAVRLVPEYRTVDQTGLDMQYLAGSWAFKLEALTNTGYGDRYAAAVAGFEHTSVGVFDTAVDVGVVVEYMYDERDGAATNTLFEHDLALGARFTGNDAADTDALVGLIWDTQSGETVLSLEASRRVGATWELNVEARWFGGSRGTLRGLTATERLAATTEGDNRGLFLAEDDYLQIELIRYF